MTLLITVFAAAIATILWYNSKADRKLGTLALMYWGASLMWLVDAVVEYIELGAEFFEQAPSDMINDAFLGLSVVALGIVIWLVVLLVKDPEGKVKAMFFPVVMYGCESWTVKKAECRRIDAFELWCWRRLLKNLRSLSVLRPPGNWRSLFRRGRLDISFVQGS